MAKKKKEIELEDALDQVDRSLSDDPDKALEVHSNSKAKNWHDDHKEHPKFDKFKNQKGSN